MNKDPVVSIIMGAYNAEKTISACIDSIINQTFTDWEFIICDDFSSDKTGEIIKYYQGKDSRIKFLQNKCNMQLAWSLNHCLEVARGKYIARMDADDISMPTRLELQVKYMRDHPNVDVVGCNRIIFGENRNDRVRVSVEYPTSDILLRDVPFAHPTILMKASVMRHLNGYTVDKTTMRAEDLDLWFRFYKEGFQGYNLQDLLYKYHESIDDLKKRTLKSAIGTARVYLRGYKLLGFPKRKWLFALKPIVAALIPDALINLYHKRGDIELPE